MAEKMTIKVPKSTMTGCLLDVGVFDLQMQYTVDKQESFVTSGTLYSCHDRAIRYVGGWMCMPDSCLWAKQ